MNILRLKKMYLPALSIVMVVLVLLVFISISTYRNLDREERYTMDSFRRQGISLIHVLSAGAGLDPDAVDALFQAAAESEDIAYIYLIDGQGKIIFRSDPTLAGEFTPRSAGPATGREAGVSIRRLAEGGRVFELARPFTGKTKIVLGLEMADFDEAREADLHHAFIMAAIVVALGAGALFFIFVIQNYYLVDKTLKTTQDYTRQVVAHMANGLLSIDTAGRIVSYNRLALELLELDEKTVQGMDLRTVLDFETTGITRTLTHHQPVLDREIAFQLSTCASLPLSISVTPILDESDRCTGAVVVLQDLREIKYLQQKVRRAEKLAAVGELAAGVAHEIRNPLSSIKGFAQFLGHTLKDNPQEKEYADIVVREVNRINRVVTDLLTFARPLSLERTRVELPELVAHTVRLVSADARSRNVEIDVQLEENLINFYMDENQITQALLNLLLNSLQAVSENGHVTVGAHIQKPEGILDLWVEDDGKGIDPEYIDKILDPFFTTRDKGTGLGLAIVNKIAENHRGEVRIESPAPGKSAGVRVTLLIPGVSPEKEAAQNETKNSCCR